MVIIKKEAGDNYKFPIRLQKMIAQAGISSRREAEEMIKQGLVTVNGEIIKEMGVLVDPVRDHVKVNNKLITRTSKLIYIIMNKPKGYITTTSDPAGRMTVLELVKNDIADVVKPVGRLDCNTEGLLLLTNDGELSNRLCHPKYKVEKIYKVKVQGVINQKNVEKLRKGVYIDGKKTHPAEVEFTGQTDKNCWLTIQISEGRNQQIRKMCDAVGHHVLKLKRTQYAFLSAKGLDVGKYRFLTDKEIIRLKENHNTDKGSTSKPKSTRAIFFEKKKKLFDKSKKRV